MKDRLSKDLYRQLRKAVESNDIRQVKNFLTQHPNINLSYRQKEFLLRDAFQKNNGPNTAVNIDLLRILFGKSLNCHSIYGDKFAVFLDTSNLSPEERSKIKELIAKDSPLSFPSDQAEELHDNVTLVGE